MRKFLSSRTVVNLLMQSSPNRNKIFKSQRSHSLKYITFHTTLFTFIIVPSHRATIFADDLIIFFCLYRFHFFFFFDFLIFHLTLEGLTLNIRNKFRTTLESDKSSQPLRFLDLNLSSSIFLSIKN